MAIITTYVCDVSGKQGGRKDFVTVTIKAQPCDPYSYSDKTVEKLVHMEVAKKLNLLASKPAGARPAPTFESKIVTLLKDYVADIAYEAASEAVANR